eukprot:2620209-Rhodomonas_salina.1
MTLQSLAERRGMLVSPPHSARERERRGKRGAWRGWAGGARGDGERDRGGRGVDVFRRRLREEAMLAERRGTPSRAKRRAG